MWLESSTGSWNYALVYVHGRAEPGPFAKADVFRLWEVLSLDFDYSCWRLVLRLLSFRNNGTAEPGRLQRQTFRWHYCAFMLGVMQKYIDTFKIFGTHAVPWIRPGASYIMIMLVTVVYGNCEGKAHSWLLCLLWPEGPSWALAAYLCNFP